MGVFVVGWFIGCGFGDLFICFVVLVGLFWLGLVFFSEHEQENVHQNLINTESLPGLFWVDASIVIFCTEYFINSSLYDK